MRRSRGEGKDKTIDVNTLHFMKKINFLRNRRFEALFFLLVFFSIFGYLGSVMGLPNMLNTMMNTSYRLLLETVLYIMGVTVLSGAIGKLFVEFGVVRLVELLLRPLMRPLYNLPGVAALGAVMTFLSDNPAILSLAKDKNFSNYFKKFQLISFTNFGTAFGMGIIVVVFMAGKGFFVASALGIVGAIIGSIVSTRIMQYLLKKHHPELMEDVSDVASGSEKDISFKSKGNAFLRVLSAIIDGGKSGVEIGFAIIPGVLIISTFVMILTMGPSDTGEYTGAAYEGVQLLPYLAGKIGFVFDWLFGFKSPELVAFPITALGAVGAALGLVPKFMADGIIDGNAITVFTAMGMCWSGFLSTYTTVFDTLGYRYLISKAIIAQVIGGVFAGISAHWIYVLYELIVSGY